MDLLSALWPYLLGALVGWMASWGLAHRFKYATDSAKTIKVEKLVEKVVEVDNPELIDRLAEVENLITDYEDQILALRADQVALESASSERPELLARIAELEANIVAYEAELSDLRTAKPPAGKAGKSTDKIVEKVVEKIVEVDRPELLARLAELETKLETSEKEREAALSARPITDQTEKLADNVSPLRQATPNKIEAENSAGKTATAKSPATKTTRAAKRAKSAKDTTTGRDESQLPLPVEQVAEPADEVPEVTKNAGGTVKTEKTTEPRKAPRKRKKPAQAATKKVLTAAARQAERSDETVQARETLPESTDHDPAADSANNDNAAQAIASGLKAEPDADPAPYLLNGSAIDWAAARSLGFKFKDPGDRADFSYVEGIGPKISSLLQEAGISSYRQLEITSTAAIRDILEKAGPRYRLADPGTWPQQAGMIADSRWQELKDWKAQLKHGKPTEDSKA